MSLTCAVLERDDVRAVPDESRLTVAAIQMAPFEIVGGSHPPDLRSGDRRFFERRYQLRIIDPDVIGRDVKLPPLAIPYRVESRVGAGSTLAGRDLVHLMPQLVFRVVSQVPADATDIRDAGDAGLGRIDALQLPRLGVPRRRADPGGARRHRRAERRCRACSAGCAATGAAPWRRCRTMPCCRPSRTRLGALIDAHPTGDLDAGRAGRGPSTGARRRRHGVRAGACARRRWPAGRAVPEGRIAVDGWLAGRGRR